MWNFFLYISKCRLWKDQPQWKIYGTQQRHMSFHSNFNRFNGSAPAYFLETRPIQLTIRKSNELRDKSCIDTFSSYVTRFSISGITWPPTNWIWYEAHVNTHCIGCGVMRRNRYKIIANKSYNYSVFALHLWNVYSELNSSKPSWGNNCRRVQFIIDQYMLEIVKL